MMIRKRMLRFALSWMQSKGSQQTYWQAVLNTEFGARIMKSQYPSSGPKSHAAAAAAKSLQSCLTLCDPMDCSPITGILQARTLEWVAISFSNAGKWKVKVKSLSCVRLFGTPWTAAYQAPPSMGFSRQEYWSGVPLPSPIISWSLLKLMSTELVMPSNRLILCLTLLLPSIFLSIVSFPTS